MLQRYYDEYDDVRSLIGIDLSPAMVSIAKKRLGRHSTIIEGDMRDLSPYHIPRAAGLISFFAVHHLSAHELPIVVQNWAQHLKTGGNVVIAAWEGEGEIDYGESADIIAYRYALADVASWFENAGLKVEKAVVYPIEEFPMDAVLVEASKT